MSLSKQEFAKRFAGKTCKRFGRGEVDKQTLRDAHRIKMEMKNILREQRRPRTKPHILANISRHHTNYGETPIECELRMRENNS